MLSSSELIVSLAVLVYYCCGTRWVGPLARKVVREYGFGGDAPLAIAEGTAELFFAGCGQATLCFFAIAYLGLGTDEAGLQFVSFVSIILGVALGICLFGVAGHLAFTVDLLIQRRCDDTHGYSVEKALALSRGGWMRQYRSAFKLSPLRAGIPLTVLYVAGEEVAFRLILFSCVKPLGVVPAVFLTAISFSAVQTLNMPSLRAAVYPIIGAIVVGVVHGWLYASTGMLVPLVVAHVVFFLVSMVV